MKDNLAIYVSKGFAYRDLSMANTLIFLAKYFKLTIIHCDLYDAKEFYMHKNIKIELPDKFRYRIWNFLFVVKQSYFQKYSLKINHNSLFPYSIIKQRIITFLSYKPIFKLFEFIMMYYLDKTNPRKIILSSEYKGILFFGSSKDLLIDDLLRTNNKIKSILSFVNWDNATSKPFLVKPDFLFTWGKQTKTLSQRIHGIKSFSVGTPRFQHYNQIINYQKPNVYNEKFTYILFAGVGIPFPEIRLINNLVAILEKNKLFNYRLIYRPHPFRWDRKDDNPSTFFFKYVINDNSESFFKPNDPNKYKFLFNSIKGLITPYSTMSLEAFLNKRPVFFITSENPYTGKAWINAVDYYPHLAFIKKKEWIFKSHNLQSLEPNFLSFLKQLNNREIGEKYYELFKQIVVNDGETYNLKLLKSLKKVLY
jgi:hypothetical protein